MHHACLNSLVFTLQKVWSITDLRTLWIRFSFFFRFHCFQSILEPKFFSCCLSRKCFHGSFYATSQNIAYDYSIYLESIFTIVYNWQKCFYFHFQPMEVLFFYWDYSLWSPKAISKEFGYLHRFSNLFRLWARGAFLTQGA